MEGVVCKLAGETGSMRSGMCHIDVRLSSEQVEDNVGRRAKHVIPFGPDEHRSGGKSRRGNQEINRALQNRLQATYTQESTEPPREIECLECEDKSDSPLEEDTEQFLRTKIDRIYGGCFRGSL